jgi:excisionase family DNA binding protein
VKQLLIPTKEAWQSLGIGRTRFFEILSEGHIQAVRLGRRTLVPVAELERFVAALPQRNESPPTNSSVQRRGAVYDSGMAAHLPREPKS